MLNTCVALGKNTDDQYDGKKWFQELCCGNFDLDESMRQL